VSPGVGPFQAFYASPLQHPLLLWMAAAIGGARALSRRGLHPSLRITCALLVALSLADAWLTARYVEGIGELPKRLASALALLFVLAGDYRFLALASAATPDGRVVPRGRSLLAAAGLTLIVPVASYGVMLALPAVLARPRVHYLVYELGFAALASALLIWHPNVRAAPWLATLTRFVRLYYGLWAAADALLLATGSDLAYALRVVPNLLYYGGFIAALGRLAPEAGQAAGEAAPG
jgi:hypothetical protein